MRPAKDCPPSIPRARRARPATALALVCLATAPGCARLAAVRKPKAEPPMLGKVTSPGGGYPGGEGKLLASAAPRPRAESPSEESPRGTTRRSSARREGPIEVVLEPPSNAPFVAPKPRAAPEPEPAPTVESLLASAREELSRIKTYRVHLTRQERIGDSLQPAEDIVLSLRRSPKAVRLEWPDGPHQGREVLFEEGGLMHINDPRSLVPRVNLAPDSPLVLRNSRRPITEAGFDAILDQIDKEIQAEREGTPGVGKMVYEGIETPEGYDRPCHKIARSAEKGDSATVYLDTKTSLPVLSTARAADGSLLESYLFRDLVADPEELASAAAFDAEARWGPPQGIFSRIARRPKIEDRTMQR